MEYNKLTFEKERSLYNIKNSVVNDCVSICLKMIYFYVFLCYNALA